MGKYRKSVSCLCALLTLILAIVSIMQDRTGGAVMWGIAFLASLFAVYASFRKRSS